MFSNTTYQVQVRARNDEGESEWAMGIGTTWADLTVAFSSATYTVSEGEETTITVTVTPTADREVKVAITVSGEGVTLPGLDTGNTLTIARGQSFGNFTISGDQDKNDVNNRVTLTLSTNAESVSVGNPSTATVTIEEPNNPPYVTTTSPITIQENRTIVVTLEATDVDSGDQITGWSMTGGSDRSLFNLTNGGVLSFKDAPDYEKPKDAGHDNSYEVEVTASDGTDDSTPLTLTVNVTNVNEPPGAPRGLSVSTNDDNPTTTLDVSWTAPDTTGIPAITGYDVQYRAGHSGTWTAHDFGSNGSAIETTVTGLDSNTTYQIQVRANNDEGEGEWAFGSGTTERTQLVVAFSSETFTVSEVGTSEITVNVTPAADRNVTVTITMTGTGATLSGLDANGELTIERRQSSAHFTISGDQDDDAMDDEVTLTLSTDADGVSLVSPFTITVTIVDDEVPNTPPVITTTSPVSVDENQAAVVTLEATDSNNDPITGWSITGGADSALFNLTNDGVLSFKTAPDYENPSDAGGDNSLEVEVTASDGTDDSTPLTLTVNVTNVNEPPGAPRGLSVSTNDGNPTTALDVSWTAPDTTGIPAITGYDVQYRAGYSGAWTAHDFGSNGSAIETTVTGLDSNTTYQVRVRATNDEGEGQWARGSDTTEKARLTITFRSETYTVEEEEEATITVNVTPAADRNVTVTVTMTGTGATLSGLDANGELTIERRQSSAHFTISGDQDDDAMDDEVTPHPKHGCRRCKFGQPLHHYRHHRRR